MRRTLVAATAVLTTAAIPLLPSSVPASQAAPPAVAPAGSAAPADTPTATATVTLITGDRVVTSGTGSRLQVLSVQPAAGREAVTFTRVHVEGHELAIPSDASALLSEERIDRRLFDVTGLVAMGYDDASRPDVPVLLEGNTRGIDADSVRDESRMNPVDMTAATVEKDGATAAWEQMLASADAGKVDAIWLDGEVETTLDESVARTGAPEAWKSGLTGKGVKVAVLDTGYDMEHPDLQGLVVDSRDFSGEGTVDDRNGHGTHVSSIVAGSGAASGGRYRGMAPDVSLLEGKVLNRFGSGNESQVLAGMVWAVQQGADVVNMSLGASVLGAGHDPLSLALNQLSEDSDTLFVVAAGNEGAAMTIGSPGAAEKALTVGSVTKDGALSEFSSQGPREDDFAVKPEITAPGSDIVAARAAGTFPDVAINTSYSRLSGTSMATPHVAGAAAILAQQHPDWDDEQLKAALVGAADPRREISPFAQGAGELDVAEATSTPVVATSDRPETALLPLTADEEPTRWTLSYANLSARPQRLKVSVELADVTTGRAAPAQLVRADADELQLAPGGAGTLQLTVDDTVTTPGRYAGEVVVTGPGKIEVVTPIAVIVNPELHAVTFHRPAKPEGIDLQFQYTLVQSKSTGDLWQFITGDAATTVDLPEDEYRVFGHVLSTDLDASSRVLASRSTHFFEEVVVSGDRDVRVDITGARPVRLGLTDTEAKPLLGSLTGVLSRVDAGGFGLLAPIGGPLHEVYVAPTGPVDGVSFLYSGIYLEPLAKATSMGQEPLELAISGTTTKPWVGNLTAPVVNVGTAAPDELGEVDVSGSIAYAKFSSSVPFAERTARMAALADAGAVAVLLGDQNATSPSLPVFAVASQQVQALEQRLTRGDLVLTLAGIAAPREGAFLADEVEGGLPHDVDLEVSSQQLAHVDTSLPAMGGASSYRNEFNARADLGGVLLGNSLFLTVPNSLRLHYTPNVSWQTQITHFTIGETTPLGWMESAPTSYESGETRTDSFIKAPFNPSLSTSGVPYAYRTGDEFRFGLPMFSDAAGHRTGNTPGIDTGSVTLTTDDGRVVDASDAPGRLTIEGMQQGERWYRLTAETRRNHVRWPLSTMVTSEWRFRSRHVESGVTALPLIDITYDVPLGLDQSVPAGRAFPVALDAAFQPGSSRQSAAITQMEYSVDHGQTWQTVSLVHERGATHAMIPALTAGTVSLRTTASAGDGTRVTETLVDAFYVR